MKIAIMEIERDGERQSRLITGAPMASGAMAEDSWGSRKGYRIEDINRQLRRDASPTGLSKDELPTPALILDLDLFEANVEKMAEHARASGTSLRPHAKAHKCVQIARRQIEAGALGICVATVAEAEVMVAGGVRGVHITSPIASRHKMQWIVRLAERSPDLMVAVDHAKQVRLYQDVAADEGRTLSVLVDINVGDRRTGVEPGEPALELATTIHRCRNLRLRGLQSYSGHSSHVVGFEARKTCSHEVITKAIATRDLLLRSGMPAEILSVGSTGTYNIDSELDGLTELQVGSYVFMDLDYRRIGGVSGEVYDDFGHSLTVLSTVVSANHSDRVTLDAGIKAFATDRSFGPQAKDVQGVSYEFGGDEFGILTLDEPGRTIRLGDRLEFIVPHCDPTVNLYDRIYACRNNQVEEIWSIMDRLRI